MMQKISALAAKAILCTLVFDQSLMALPFEEEQTIIKKSNSITLKALGHKEILKTILVRFNQPLSNNQKERFYQKGVDTIVYAGDMSYYFYLPRTMVEDIANEDGVEGIEEVDPKLRVSNSLGENLDLITMSSESTIALNILFLKEFTQKELERYFDANGIEAKIEKVIPFLCQAKVHVSREAYEKLSHLPLVKYMDRVLKIGKNSMFDSLPSLEVLNSKVADTLNAKVLWGTPYNLQGENTKVGIVDGGLIKKDHVEFLPGHVHDETSDGEVSFHATHVGGTIAAIGKNPNAKGIASYVDLYSYSFDDGAFSEAVLNMYKRNGILLSNHSYGYSQKERLAEYDSIASTQDLTVHKNPYLTIVEAAGNDGEDENYGEYGIIKGPGNSKNILTIGALNSEATAMATLSSTGPVRDGRIKPDLCARGEYVLSPTSESSTSYAMMSGTSMAAPAATGAAALVMQEYRRVTGGADMRHDTLKAVMINSAKDLENPGPDYKVGFGLIDAKGAVDIVASLQETDPLISLGRVTHQEQRSYAFTTMGSGYFKATIVWVDPEANPSAKKSLVNDIDMVLVDVKSGQKYYPYTLDKDNPSANAVQNKENHVDNIEQIEVKNLPAGEYRLLVKGSNIITSSQEYSIASSMPIFERSNIETLHESRLQNFVRKMLLATL